MLKHLIRRRKTLLPKFSTHSHSLSSFADDPPFSLIPKPQKTTNKREKQPHDSKNTPNFPLKTNLPFDFRHSYSESDPHVDPIGFREPPKFSPFGPGWVDRKWTGSCAPFKGGKEEREKWDGFRERVLGEPLSEEEIEELVEKYRHNDCNRQINIGKDGVTHNMLDDIHNHWRRAEAVRIKCLGIPTLDMDNVCFHLEDKSCGKVIYRHLNVLLLYRGRNYDPKNRPVIPLMLWKPPRNGVYVNVVQRVRDAFETEEVVRLDCTYVGTSDCKRIGVKLRDLVPCVPILFKDEQIILWRGKRDQDDQAS
ncbi:CRS2-associated factor 2 mitochondrial [Bienertia sinuspersici]